MFFFFLKTTANSAKRVITPKNHIEYIHLFKMLQFVGKPSLYYFRVLHSLLSMYNLQSRYVRSKFIRKKRRGKKMFTNQNRTKNISNTRTHTCTNVLHYLYVLHFHTCTLSMCPNEIKVYNVNTSLIEI